jgi:histidine triad (HIT) family protein
VSDCLFCAIAQGDIPADVVLADDDVVAFRDLHPQAPTHVLVIPREHHATAAALAEAAPALAGRLLAAAGTVAEREGLAADGYRIVTNTGARAGQTVHHVHLHVLGGRDLTWPPG